MIPVNDLKRQNAPLLPALAAAAAEVLEGGWYILGPRVAAFEKAFASYCGTAECITTGNGTDALELALRACGAGPGGQVAVVANAGGYGTAAVRAAGAEPLFVDVEPEFMLMDAGSLEARITPRTRAVIVTHLYGRMADMPRLLAVTAPRGLAVIEDCAQAHGARIGGKLAGAWGTAGCFSFYPTKNLGALGDGGAIVTGDAGVAERARRLRQYGWASKYRSTLAGGRNSRLDEIQAALLAVKLPLLDEWNERRRAIARRYDRALGLTRARDAADVAHLYALRTRNRDAARERLAAAGIGTDVHYPIPDHRQESARGEPWAEPALPVTEQCCRETLTVPCFPELTTEEVERVAAALASM
jgi:dTDP-4-amino-4,6-dideoxygalactose transaminase